MSLVYLMHKKMVAVGVADLPDFVKFDENPPRSFEIYWKHGGSYRYPCQTDKVIPITKEVYDLSPSEPLVYNRSV